MCFHRRVVSPFLFDSTNFLSTKSYENSFITPLYIIIIYSVKEKERLTTEERNLLSVAYKNVVGARRASWRVLHSIEQKETDRRANICGEILTLIQNTLIKHSVESEERVFYYKMKDVTEEARQSYMRQIQFKASVGELEELNEEEYKDATLIMQLLRDNLTLWQSEAGVESMRIEDDGTEVAEVDGEADDDF
eukprot:GSMAST32.ASY1.ANO1.1882.1 assembled CDS